MIEPFEFENKTFEAVEIINSNSCAECFFCGKSCVGKRCRKEIPECSDFKKHKYFVFKLIEGDKKNVISNRRCK